MSPACCSIATSSDTARAASSCASRLAAREDGLAACSGSPSDLVREQLPSRRPRAMAMNRKRLKARIERD